MGEGGDAVGEISDTETAYAEKLVGGKAGDIRAPFFRIQDPMGRMLDCVNINVNVRMDMPVR